MPLFTYTISTENGSLSTGTLMATNKESALRKLSKAGNQVLSLKEGEKKEKWWEWSSGLSQKEILLVTKRIADMTEQGFSVVDALRTIELQAQNPTLKKVSENLKSKVELGNTLADAMSAYPKYFSNVYRSIVQVGEESGTISKSLTYLEKQVESSYKLRKKVISALTYPIVIIVLMSVIGVGMIVFLIPFLKDIFSTFEAKLPISTRILLRSEEYLTTYWWLIIGVITSLIVGTKLLLKNQKIQKLKDNMALHIPLVGSLMKSFNVAQIIRTFTTLNKTGIPIVKALDILCTVPHNTAYKQALNAIKADVSKGEILSAAIAKHPKLFSPLVIESIKLGEKAGNLSDSLSYLSELFEDDVKESLTTLTTFIQPLLLVLVGVMVAGFAISIIVPLQQLPRLMQQ